MRGAIKRYLWNVLISVDQLANTLFGPALNFVFGVTGFGYPDETLSSVMGKYRARCRLCRVLCRMLDRVDPGHCQNSIEPDEGEWEEHA